MAPVDKMILKRKNLLEKVERKGIYDLSVGRNTSRLDMTQNDGFQSKK